MSKLNKKVVNKIEDSAHKNFMGGDSWDITSPFTRLRMVAASSFFGEPKYYNEDGSINKSKKVAIDYLNSNHEYNRSILGGIDDTGWKGLSSQELMEKNIDDCLNVDIEQTLQIAVSLRNEDYIRSTPQVILVRAAMHSNSKGTGLITTYGPKICKRGDEPAAGMSYFLATYSRKTALPNSLKKLWKSVLESFDDYTISKYRMDKNFVKTVDVVRMVHAHSSAIDKLMAGKAKQEKTWNTIISNSSNKTETDRKENWEKAISSMGHMALLRNLRNFISNSVDPTLYCDKLLSGVATGKQLPFRYLSAYNAIEKLNGSSKIIDVIEQCLEDSFINAPHFSGKVMCLSDNSGSAHGALTSEFGTMSVAKIGNLMSVMTAKMADEGQVGVFGDKLQVIDVRKKQSVFDLVKQANQYGNWVGRATENGIWLFWDDAIRNKKHYDHVFVYSDMQAGHGGLYGCNHHDYENYLWNNSTHINVPKLISEYRKTVNPNVMVYLIQTAGYGDVLIPEYFNRTFILGGWSPNIPQFAAEMSKLADNKQ